MKNNSKIYVAGHKGMVGSAIKSKLKNQNFENLIFKNSSELDLRNQSATQEFFEKNQPEYVFLSAAKVGGIIANNTYKADFIYDNMAIALNVIKSSKDNNVKKLLNLGSSCIYPKFANQPLTEEDLLTGLLEPTNEPYAIAKISAIKLCRYFREQYNCDFISLMPTNLYGINDTYHLQNSHVLPALLRKMILGKAIMDENFELIIKDIKKRKIGWGIDESIDFNSNQNIIECLAKAGVFENSIYIWGSGNVKREFLHSDDLAEASIYFMNFQDSHLLGEFINIGAGEDISIKELAKIIKEIVDYKGVLGFDSSKPDGTPRKLMNVAKANNLGWKHKINLEDGIKQVYQSYKSSF